MAGGAVTLGLQSSDWFAPTSWSPVRLLPYGLSDSATPFLILLLATAACGVAAIRTSHLLPMSPGNGPEPGSALPVLTVSRTNGNEAAIRGGYGDAGTLVAFLASNCVGCERAARALGERVETFHARKADVRVIISGPESDGQTLLSSLLESESITFDPTYTIAEQFGISIYPTVLFYNGDNVLVRKEVIPSEVSLDAILGGLTLGAVAAETKPSAIAYAEN